VVKKKVMAGETPTVKKQRGPLSGRFFSLKVEGDIGRTGWKGGGRQPYRKFQKKFLLLGIKKPAGPFCAARGPIGKNKTWGVRFGEQKKKNKTPPPGRQPSGWGGGAGGQGKPGRLGRGIFNGPVSDGSGRQTGEDGREFRGTQKPGEGQNIWGGGRGRVLGQRDPRGKGTHRPPALLGGGPAANGGRTRKHPSKVKKRKKNF